MNGQWSAAIVRALGAMSWLGPTPVLPPDIARLVVQDAKRERVKPASHRDPACGTPVMCMAS
jgi:hypothetical protein